MRKLYVSALALLAGSLSFAQLGFEKEISVASEFLAPQVVMPAAPLEMDYLFVGGEDMVQTTATYGNAAGETPAKQWHDFIGVTPVYNNGEYEGEFWVSVNHEMILADSMIGDGGGMTVFKCSEDMVTGEVTVMDGIELPDGRTGKFFNVDFVNTVGETGMNCGGVQSFDGRIWTAEEWFRDDNSDISRGGTGVLDTLPWTISSDIPGGFDGKVVEKYQNFNWMVEIDPMTGKAIRKQYNMGRFGFEGGAIPVDNSVMYLGIDATPAPWARFVCDVPGDFTEGSLEVYVQSEEFGSRWVEIPNDSIESTLMASENAFAAGATMLNRIEWVAIDSATGLVYMTETGRDGVGGEWVDEFGDGGEYAEHHIARADEQGVDIATDDYKDFYGRILVYNPATEELDVFLEAGSTDPSLDGRSSVGPHNYSDIHLSNPDGLSVMYSGGKAYLVIQEDLNGTSMNRVPQGYTNRTCEMFLLDLSIENPTLSDLVRITAVPQGAEITGGKSTPSGKAILVNSQHPNSDDMVNDFPFNNSLTAAIYGFEGMLVANKEVASKAGSFTVFPNPTAQEITLSEAGDVAIYNVEGKLVKVVRDASTINVSDLAVGTYIIKNAEGDSLTFSVQ